jgi:phospholipid/cholesterol/gamma-HCH transport system substrate-binding protein
MATRSTYLKLGLFVVLCGCALVAVGILIGLRRIHREVVSVYTFFDESVTGLEVGSPVRARGVPIGQVGEITFAPDHRMVSVRSDIDVEEVVRLGFPSPGEKGHIQVPSYVRARLASQGLTGGRYIALDFFDEKTHPPPELSFPPPENYIPAERSVQNSLEQAASTAMNGLASLVETLRSQHLAERVVHTTTEADEVMALLQQVLRSIQQQHLPQRATATVEELRLAANRINRLLDQIGGEAGLIATTQRSVGAVGEAGRQATDTTHNLGETIEEIRSAAAAVRTLADRLERDPDMLLKGRGKEEAP